MIKLKYILPLLFSFACAISQAQKDEGYMIPNVNVEKSTDSIVAQLRKDKIDTIAVRYEVCGMCYQTLYKKGTKKRYLTFSADGIINTFIFWFKDHKIFCLKIDRFAIYNPIIRKSTAIFTYAYFNWKAIKSERFITDLTNEINKNGDSIRTEGECYTGDGTSNGTTFYLADSELYVKMRPCNIDFSVNDAFFIRNFTSKTHILELMIQNEINDLQYLDWQANSKLYYTRREFMKWKHLHKKELIK